MGIFSKGFPVPIVVPPALGSPLYHTHWAPVPSDPPFTVRSTDPFPQIVVGFGITDEGFVDNELTDTVTSFDAIELQLVLTTLLKQVFWVVPSGGS